MRLAKVTEGIVKNIILVDPAAVPDWAADWPIASANAGPGWLYDGNTFSPPINNLAEEREQMVCSALQGKLALGAERWADVEALLNDTETPWAMKQVILTATQWPRNSQMMTELAWLLDYDDSEVDDLFRLAMSIEV